MLNPKVFRLAAQICLEEKKACCISIARACDEMLLDHYPYIRLFRSMFNADWDYASYCRNWGDWNSSRKAIEPRVMALLICELEAKCSIFE